MNKGQEFQPGEAMGRLVSCVVFVVLLAGTAIAAACAPSRGATVTRADNVVAVRHTPAGDVVYLPPEAP